MGIMTPEEIEMEANARVEFKMQELLTGVKNQELVHWHVAFNNMSQKHQHYWKAFEQMESMWKKELRMPTPRSDMYDQRMRKVKNDAAEDIMQVLDRSNIRNPRDRDYIRGKIANLIESATKEAIDFRTIK